MYEYVETKIGDTTLKIETGKYAKQADGSCLVTFGETIVLATAVSSKKAPEDFLDFFPLTVNYQEKFYAAGKIPGGFMKREGRPGIHETLTSRLIDRTIRPLFPKDYKQETQVIITVVSSDGENDPAIISILAASCALSISDIPFLGPVAGTRITKIDSKLEAFAPSDKIDKSSLNLVLSGTKDAINMIEARADELSESEMIDAIMFGKDAILQLIDMQNELVKKSGKAKRDYTPVDVSDEIVYKIESLSRDDLLKALEIKEKKVRNETIDEIFNNVYETLEKEFDEETHLKEKSKAAFEDIVKNLIRGKIITTGIRIDGRGLDEIRPISCEVGVLPRAHGSAVFTRGETQALVAVTLGSKEDSQRIDDISGEASERFMLHYNFPPFSTGEVKRLGTPGRREIGHGHLAKRALEFVLPKETDFPYVIRIVSDILESNGSSSMATVCGSTLSLLDAGVPITKPVSGIAMGLIKMDDSYNILTDILGDEDHYGDMDFKVTGTKDGITALQMDIKIAGVDAAMLNVALEKAKVARLFILEKMATALSAPRDTLSKYAPQMKTLNIDTDKIKDLIGPGGKTIKSIIDETNVKIDIGQDGVVNIFGAQDSDMKKALQIIKNLTTVVKEGDIFEGKVVRIENFGAFVNILPNKDGLLHISQISSKRINKVEDVLKTGDIVKVKVIGVDKQGRVSLSRKELLTEKDKEN